MVKIQIKEVYKEEVKPTQTLQYDIIDEVVLKEATSKVKGRIKELTDRLFDENDKLQAFYVSMTDE